MDPETRWIRAKLTGILMKSFRQSYAVEGGKIGLSQESLLDLMSKVDPRYFKTYDRSTVSKWETGKVLPSRERLEVFGKALNLSTAQIGELIRLADLGATDEDGPISGVQEHEDYPGVRQGVSSGSCGLEESADVGGDDPPLHTVGRLRHSAARMLARRSFVSGLICVLVSLAIALGALVGTGRLAFSGDSLVFSIGNRSDMKADFAAEVQDVWLSPDTVHARESADINARVRNLSPSGGPYGGEATFDVAIAVRPPSGPEIHFHWNDAVFSYNHVETYQKSQYKFDQAGPYTIHAEVYSNKGKENGWVIDDRFASLTQSFIITESSDGTPSDSAPAGYEANALKAGR